MEKKSAQRKLSSKKFVIWISITVCLLAGKLFFSAAPVFIFNHSPFLVGSSSMEPEFPVNSVVIIKKEPFSTLRVGDVIVFKSDALGGSLAFHRISRVGADGVYTKGDNNKHGDNQLITESGYVGKCVLKISFFARWLTAVKKTAGFFLYFLLPVFAAGMIWYSLKQFRKKGG